MMTLSRMDRRRAYRLAELLDQTGPGPRTHRRTGVDDEVLPLAQIAHRLEMLPPQPTPGHDFATSLRSLLVAAAERDGIGVTARTVDPRVVAETTTWLALRPLGSHSSSTRRRATRPAASTTGRGPGRARVAILVGVTVGAIVASGVSAASTGAVPGDTLYGVKRSTERAQLAFAGSDASRGKLYLEFARSRLAEASRVPPDAVIALLADMNSEIRQGVGFMAAAIATGDRTALAGLASFTQAQAVELDKLGATLPTAVRERAVGPSRQLLLDVQDRVALLTAALAAGCPFTEVDRLGPKPSATC